MVSNFFFPKLILVIIRDKSVFQSGQAMFFQIVGDLTWRIKIPAS